MSDIALIDVKGKVNANTNKNEQFLLIRQILNFCIALTAAFFLLCGGASAQELMPRAYWPTPNGTNVFVVAYGRSVGDIVTDPPLPVTGVDSKIDNLSLTYQRTFSLFDRTAKVQFTVPYSRGDTEGLGVVLLEAMHYGRPVVGSDTGGITDIIKHNQSGLLAKPGNPEDLAEKILLVLEDPQLAQRLAEQGALFAETEFNWEGIIDRWEKFYTSMGSG